LDAGRDLPDLPASPQLSAKVATQALDRRPATAVASSKL
jgi:hypothetical protein